MLDSKVTSLKAEHKIVLNLREKLSITGVKEIINFDDKSLSAKTICGEINIEGENIHINVLNVEVGELEISGKISGIYYLDIYDGDKKSLLARIFK